MTAQLDAPQMHACPSTVTEEEGCLGCSFVVITSAIPKSLTGIGVRESFSASVFFCKMNSACWPAIITQCYRVSPGR